MASDDNPSLTGCTPPRGGSRPGSSTVGMVSSRRPRDVHGARPHSGQRPIVRRSRPHLRQDCAATAVLPRAGPRTCPAGLRRPGGTQDPRPALRGAPRGHPLTGRGRPRWTSSVLDVVNGLIPSASSSRRAVATCQRAPFTRVTPASAPSSDSQGPDHQPGVLCGARDKYAACPAGRAWGGRAVGGPAALWTVIR